MTPSYIGNQPNRASVRYLEYGTFDNESNTIMIEKGYQVNSIEVTVGGVVLDQTQYTATDGATISLSQSYPAGTHWRVDEYQDLDTIDGSKFFDRANHTGTQTADTISDLDDYIVERKSFVTAIDFGVPVDGTTDSTSAVKDYLDTDPNNGHFIFPSGQYCFSDEIELPPEAHIWCHPTKTIFQRTPGTDQSDVWYLIANFPIGSGSASGYNGTGHITWYGGVIDNMHMAMFHATMLSFTQLTMKNGMGHFIEFNGNSNTTFRECVFDDNMTLQDDNESGDALNIDFSGQSNFPGAGGGYDDTHCFNILVDRCYFRKSYTGVGSHKYIQPSNVRVRIVGCTFEDTKYHAVNCRWGIGWEVSGNTIIRNGYQGILFRQADRCIAFGNMFVDCTSTNLISLYRSKHCRCFANTSYDTSGTSQYGSVYRLQAAERCNIETQGMLPGTGTYPLIYVVWPDETFNNVIDGWALLFSGDASLEVGETVDLTDSLSYYGELQVMTHGNRVGTDTIRTFNLETGFSSDETFPTQNGDLSPAGDTLKQLTNAGDSTIRVRRVYGKLTSYASYVVEDEITG